MLEHLLIHAPNEGKPQKSSFFLVDSPLRERGGKELSIKEKITFFQMFFF